jgi:hypothetical protein
MYERYLDQKIVSARKMNTRSNSTPVLDEFASRTNSKNPAQPYIDTETGPVG